MDEQVSENARPRRGWSEDTWAIVLGIAVFGIAVWAVTIGGNDWLNGRLNQPGKWTDSPLESLLGSEKNPLLKPTAVSLGVLGVLALPALITRGRREHGHPAWMVMIGYIAVALLATLAFVLAGQSVIKQFGFEYVFWALILGMVICNTVGTPRWMQGAVQGELFIKWGLVLLGAEVLIGKLVLLGLPGILVSWLVTPVVLVLTFLFGCHVLKIPSPALVMVVAADMSVCGASAAIATAAACRAKQQELSMAIALSLCFTAIMMVAMPWILRGFGVNEIVAGAWIGGTIDSTGAVAAAGALMGDDSPEGVARADRAVKVATTVKMIQNVLIGVIAFAVSIYWATRYDLNNEQTGPRPQHTFRELAAEVWLRFPKFVLGFVGTSLLASTLVWSGPGGEALVDSVVGEGTKHLRNWLFCLAFVCIGLDTNFRTLLPVLSGGKTVVLYVCGQALNVLLTGIMAFLVFGWLFYDKIQAWLPISNP